MERIPQKIMERTDVPFEVLDKAMDIMIKHFKAKREAAESKLLEELEKEDLDRSSLPD